MEIIIDKINYIMGLIGIITGLFGYYKYGLIKKKEYLKKKSKVRIEEYQQVISSKEFNNWILKIIKKIYDVESLGFNLVSINDNVYPSIFFLTNNSASTYPFKKIMEPLDWNNISIKHISFNKLQQEYSNMLEGTILRPKLIGYKLKKLKLDENNRVAHISADICNYEQNVMTSHILEYELYQLYQSNKEIVNSSREIILSKLEFLGKIHNSMSLEEVLFTGIGRHSLLSVQMIVLFKTNEGIYKVLLMQRSTDVAAKPGYWQFMPAGGFEMFEKEDTSDTIAIKNNYDVKMAIFREFIEELYNKEEYIHNVKGNPAENILNDPHIIEIEKLIKTKKAKMELIGSAIDLVTLRHEISFILRIDDIEFTQSDRFKFDTNHEIHNMYQVNITEIEDALTEGVMVPSNAALYQMAKSHHLFKEALLESQKV